MKIEYNAIIKKFKSERLGFLNFSAKSHKLKVIIIFNPKSGI